MTQSDYYTLLPSFTDREVVNKEVTLLLGTDSHIEEGTQNQEKRVGVTASQIGSLKSWLEWLEISLNFYFISGAGNGANQSDAQYMQVGGKPVHRYEASHVPPPNVVHALKEPGLYESRIPGKFMRIGALHTGSESVFSTDNGIGSMLLASNFSAIFDGSSIGGTSYKIRKNFPIPIRSSMSVFAGEIAAEVALESLAAIKGKCVISGGGIVGIAATNWLLAHGTESCTEIIIIERNPIQRSYLEELYKPNSTVRVFLEDSVHPTHLRQAGALILCAFTPGIPAPKVVQVEDLINMSDKAAIIDVSIDEGGSIRSRPGQTVEQTLAQFRKNLKYIADTHMPRNKPEEASEKHGRAVLPYLATMLYLSAKFGGTDQAVDHILQMRRVESSIETYEQALICDLAAGVAFECKQDRIFIHQDVVKNPKAASQFLTQNQIACSLI